MGTPIAAMLSKNLQLFIVPLESSTMLSDNDGVCNSMPGWNPLSIWNPRDYHEDPDCRLNPMYQQRAWASVLPTAASTNCNAYQGSRLGDGGMVPSAASRHDSLL